MNKLKPILFTVISTLTISISAFAENSYQCLSCPAGTYSDNGTSCKKCAAGTYSVGGADSCRPCPVGTYQPEEGMPFCVNCPPDRYISEGSYCSNVVFAYNSVINCSSIQPPKLDSINKRLKANKSYVYVDTIYKKHAIVIVPYKDVDIRVSTMHSSNVNYFTYYSIPSDIFKVIDKDNYETLKNRVAKQVSFINKGGVAVCELYYNMRYDK